MAILRQIWGEEDGQDLVEYALLLAFLSLGALGILSGIGTGSLTPLWQYIDNGLNTASNAAS